MLASPSTVPGTKSVGSFALISVAASIDEKLINTIAMVITSAINRLVCFMVKCLLYFNYTYYIIV